MSAETVRDRVIAHLERLYPSHDTVRLADRVLAAVGLEPDSTAVGTPPAPQRWDHTDVVLITYADAVTDGGRPPLEVLDQVVTDDLEGLVSTVHVLPFFPSSSDRGFAVIDHTMVDPALGSWDHLDALGRRVDLMMDLVINHVSARSAWFEQFVADAAPGRDYFMVASPDDDLTDVVRPRDLPLLHPVSTASGERQVWCTFSADQVDLDVSNPEVLIELMRIVDVLVSHGARFLRLDAIAYLWKRIGSACIHLPETHEVVRLLHTLMAARSPRTAIVTETNVPPLENLSYLGDGAEAHVVYNFTLPPLVIDALVRGSADRLSRWLVTQPDPPPGCTTLNFLTSHDGIGLRPAEGLLTDGELDSLVELTHRRGGLHGTYSRAGGSRPYELNLPLLDLLGDPGGRDATGAGCDETALARHRCAHALMLALRGVPAIYLNTLLAVPADPEGALASGVRRDITRARVELGRLRSWLGDPASVQRRVLDDLAHLVRVRRAAPAFHPDGTQRPVELGGRIVAFERTCPAGAQQLVALHEVAGTHHVLDTTALAPAAVGWHDLLTGEAVADTVTLAPYGVRWLADRTGDG